MKVRFMMLLNKLHAIMKYNQWVLMALATLRGIGYLLFNFGTNKPTNQITIEVLELL